MSMNQILNRIFRIAKSYGDSYRFDEKFSAFEDEDLKKAFEELENETKSSRKDTDKETESFEKKRDEISSLKQAADILGIDESAAPMQIKAAYLKKIKEYHPDKVETLGGELKQLAAKKTLQINSAYQFLRKAKNF